MQTIIYLPGKFDSDFSGSSVGQGQIENSGYDGAALLYSAYKAATTVKRGKGHSVRLVLEGTAGDIAAALYCLFDYADTFVISNGEEPEYRTARNSADVMRRRARYAAAAFGEDITQRCWSLS